MDLKITFLGTGATSPSKHRGLPATLIQRGGHKYLIDCGEGTQRQLWNACGGLIDIDAILLTHYHTDHILGLPGLVNSYQLRGRQRPLEVYGPEPLRRNIKRFAQLIGQQTKAMLDLHEIELSEKAPFKRGDDYKWFAQSVPHGNGALAYALVEDRRPGRLDVAKAQELGIHDGREYGLLKAGEPVRGVEPSEVIGPSRPGRKVVISGDTPPCRELELLAYQADLLIHDATLLESDDDNKTEHSTALEAAKLAANAEVKRLALYHIAAKCSRREVIREARQAFPEVVVPNDFDVIEIPLS